MLCAIVIALHKQYLHNLPRFYSWRKKMPSFGYIFLDLSMDQHKMIKYHKA